MSGLNEEEATKEVAQPVTALSNDDRLIICSGQVVTSLGVAVKELVENALDAKASHIEIKFKEQGLGGVEVIDNGCGVSPENFANLTARHATSKLEKFSDLGSVQTFGFRGEALNSLCALGDVVITTRDKNAFSATRLEFDHKGQIKKKSPSHGNQGTRVQLTNLFKTLPVRKREFQKSIKKQYAKAIDILSGYCLVSKSIRIDVTNCSKDGISSPVMSTSQTGTTLDNIRSIYGKNQAEKLVQVKKPILEGKDAERLKLYEIEGWVSDCNHGSGNSSKSRQFFYINGRPCESKEIVKFINEIYRKFNSHQYPFIFLNISIDRNLVDINVTPDKRQLFVNDEKLLKQAIEKSLTATYEEMQQTFQLKTVKSFFNTSQTQTKKDSETIPESDDDEDDELEVVQGKPGQYGRKLSQWKATGSTEDDEFSPEKRFKRKLEDEIEERTKKMKKIQDALRGNRSRKPDGLSDSEDETNFESESDLDSYATGVLTPKKSTETSFKVTIISPGKSTGEQVVKTISCRVPSRRGSLVTEPSQSTSTLETTSALQQTLKDQTTFLTPPEEDEDSLLEAIEPDQDKTEPAPLKSLNAQLHLLEKSLPKIETPKKPPKKKLCLPTPTAIKSSKTSLLLPSKLHSHRSTTSITIDDIQRLKKQAAEKQVVSEENDSVACTFKTKVNSKNAEEELSRQITKEMFLQMKIIGQFNLGFILVTLGNDLFIVDQHASDEKYNFEDLSKNYTIQSQQLVNPQKLDLTTIDQMILIDHKCVFEKNGFKFKTDENGDIVQPVQVTAKPISKNWEFGKEDISELIHLIQNAADLSRVRPSRVRAMFASRACRKSVMIGDSLRPSDMRQIVDHLSLLDSPWNCPHGRPTMRHVVNLLHVQEQAHLSEES